MVSFLFEFEERSSSKSHFNQDLSQWLNQVNELIQVAMLPTSLLPLNSDCHSVFNFHFQHLKLSNLE